MADPCGSGPTTETPATAARSNTPTTIVAPTTAINTPGILGHRRLKIRTMARHDDADRNGCPVGQALRNALHQADRFLNQIIPARREAEDFGQLADEHGERDAVQIAQADGLGEQIGDEAEARQPGEDAQGAGEEGEHAGQRHQAVGVAGGQRHNGRGDDRGQRRVRPQHQDAAWPEDGVRDQRARWWRTGRRSQAGRRLRRTPCPPGRGWP